jgi:cytochrome c-L
VRYRYSGLLALVAASLVLTRICAFGQPAPSSEEPAASGGGDLVFHHVLDNSVIDFSFKPDQQITEAVTAFHKTAVNPYNGNAEAIASGKALYDSLCAACHLKDGTGRIGPNLIDNEYHYPQVATDKGLFEIIYAGGAGAMQAFGRRISQDEILHVMAYVHQLRGE